MTSDTSVHRAALWALLLGNFVIGVGVLMPAGLLNELSAAFAQDAVTTARLIGYGAAVLFVEAPLLAFLTNRLDRRRLLVASLVLYSVGHFASAFAPNFEILLIARLLMIGGAAAFTPQAASAVGLFLPVERRASAVAFIFLGWSAASAIGVPLAAAVGAYANWTTAYLAMGAIAAMSAVGVYLTLPTGLLAPRLSIAAWQSVFANGRILLTLAVTMIFIAGQFTVYPYVAAMLKAQFDAQPHTIQICFAAYGAAGVVSSMVAARFIGRLGASRTVNLHLGVVMCGLLLWSLSQSWLIVAVIGLMIWGYGGGPAISGQQARLIAANPSASSASVALNTSVLYAGQALGTQTGGLLLQQQHLAWTGYVAVMFLSVALATSFFVQRRLHG